MDALDLLNHLRRAGLVLTLMPAGGLHVAPRSALTDDRRTAIRSARDALVRALQAETASPPLPPRQSGNPLMSPEQGDECHAGGWDVAEIDTYMARIARFARMGRVDAEHLAERLTLRDRQHDDRRLCAECQELEISGRCAAARRGETRGADRRLEPVPSMLMRCEAFR